MNRKKTRKTKLAVKVAKALLPAYITAVQVKKHTLRRRLFVRLLRKL